MSTVMIMIATTTMTGIVMTTTITTTGKSG
jgi:hypothetical protein